MAENNKPTNNGASGNTGPFVVGGPRCDYLNSIPKSPAVDFTLTNDAYSAPNGLAVDFQLKCDVSFEDIEISGSITTSVVQSSADVQHFQSIIAGGRPRLEEIQSDSDVSVFGVASGAFRGEIASESAVEVLTNISGSIGSGEISSDSSLTVYRDISVFGREQFAIKVYGEIAAEAIISGSGEFSTSITGRLDGEEYPALSGQWPSDSIASNSGEIQVVTAIGGGVVWADPIVSAGVVEVLYNVAGRLTGEIASESGSIDAVSQVQGALPSGTIVSSGRAEFIGKLSVEGNIRSGSIKSTGSADPLATIEGFPRSAIESTGDVEVLWFGWVENGAPRISNISSSSDIQHYEAAQFRDHAFQFGGIRSSGSAQFFFPVYINGANTLNIGVDGKADFINVVSGDMSSGRVVVSSEIEHVKPENVPDPVIASGRFNFIFDSIRLVASASAIPFVAGDFKQDEISSKGSSEGQVVVLPSIMPTLGVISWVHGNITYGDNEHDQIDQIYELSNARKVDIAEATPDAKYAVRLNTSEFNLSMEELRIGTVSFEFDLGSEVKEIQKINVWLENENGSTRLDTMRWNDRRYDVKQPHILFEPFKVNPTLRIPVHCISPKQNQFFIEIDYLNPELDEVEKRSRGFTERQSFIFPFQAHYENVDPWANIADHYKMVPTGSPNTTATFRLEEPRVIQLPLEDTLNGVLYATTNVGFVLESDNLRITNYLWEDTFKPYMNGGATYIKIESVDLYNINIGG